MAYVESWLGVDARAPSKLYLDAVAAAALPRNGRPRTEYNHVSKTSRQTSHDEKVHVTVKIACAERANSLTTVQLPTVAQPTSQSPL